MAKFPKDTPRQRVIRALESLGFQSGSMSKAIPAYLAVVFSVPCIENRADCTVIPDEKAPGVYAAAENRRASPPSRDRVDKRTRRKYQARLPRCVDPAPDRGADNPPLP